MAANLNSHLRDFAPDGWLQSERFCSVFVGRFKICSNRQMRMHNKRVCQREFSDCWSCNFKVFLEKPYKMYLQTKTFYAELKSPNSHKRCYLKVEQQCECVSEATYRWLLQMREKLGEVLIVEIVVCAKAMQFATLLNKPNLKASKKRFTCWKIVMDWMYTR